MKEVPKAKKIAEGDTRTKRAERSRAERSDKRIHVALPVRITYTDKNKKPTLEMACTYDISARGARISRLRCVRETGEILAVERGRNKAFCRVVWIGEPGSEMSGQIGLQCVESERAIFDNELRDMENIYHPVVRDTTLRRPNAAADKGNRRQQQRYKVEGMAEVLKENRGVEKARLKNLSEMGCLVTTKQVLIPGTDLKLVLNVANYNLNLKGQVRHSLDVGIGIEFTEIRRGDQQMLKYLLSRLQEQEIDEVLEVDARS